MRPISVYRTARSVGPWWLLATSTVCCFCSCSCRIFCFLHATNCVYTGHHWWLFLNELKSLSNVALPYPAPPPLRSVVCGLFWFLFTGLWFFNCLAAGTVFLLLLHWVTFIASTIAIGNMWPPVTLSNCPSGCCCCWLKRTCASVHMVYVHECVCMYMCDGCCMMRPTAKHFTWRFLQLFRFYLVCFWVVFFLVLIVGGCCWRIFRHSIQFVLCFCGPRQFLLRYSLCAECCHWVEANA